MQAVRDDPATVTPRCARRQGDDARARIMYGRPAEQRGGRGGHPWARRSTLAPDPGEGLLDHQTPGQDHEPGCRPGSADRLQSRFEALRCRRGRPCVRSASTAAGRRRPARGVPEHPLLPGSCARPVAAPIERLSHIAAGHSGVGDSGGGTRRWAAFSSVSMGLARLRLLRFSQRAGGAADGTAVMAPMAPPLVWRVVTASSPHDLCHRGPGGALVPRRERCPLLWALAERRAARGDDDGCPRGDGRLVPISWSAAPLADDVSGVCQGMVVLIVETAADRRAGRERAERAGQSERMEQAERAARARALESLAERLTLVAESTDVLGQTLEVDEALARLSRVLAPRLADWAAVDLRVGFGQVHRVAVTGREGREAWQEDWRGHLPRSGRRPTRPWSRY